MSKIYICIDLKSFYASVECVERNLDPLNTNLVVADSSRTDKTVCLAVTPTLKSYGVSGRARLFEVKQRIKEVNKERALKKKLTKKSYIDSELKENPNYEVDFLIATPRMKLYMDYSAKIYQIYLKYVSCEDIYSYSVDEIFADISEYLSYYNLTCEELTMKMIEDVYKTTGVTATAGIGTNMYLAKIAMDVKAKKMEPNEFGVRIAYLDEESYKHEMWDHTPLTDFWRIGPGISKRLIENNMNTLGDIARVSINNEDLLYKLFGVNAELLIDHVWGYEPCTLKEVKAYKPQTNNMSRGQVLHRPYEFLEAKLILREMVDNLVLDIIKKDLVTSQFIVIIGFDIDNLKIGRIANHYYGDFEYDRYGRKVPKHARITANFVKKTNSLKIITDKIINEYEKIVDPLLLIRRITVNACDLSIKKEKEVVIKQIDLFAPNIEVVEDKDELKIQEAIINIKSKFGSNSILKGSNLEKHSTAIERGRDVGGHKG